MLAAILQQHAELVARRAADHVTGTQGAGKPFAHAHDHFVAGIEAETVIDHGQAVDGRRPGRRRLRLSALADSMAWDSSSRKGVAVEMAGQFIARRQIGEAAHFAETFGGIAHQPDQARGAAVPRRGSGSAHGEIDRPQAPGDFDVGHEGGRSTAARFQHRLKLFAPLRQNGVQEAARIGGIQMHRHKIVAPSQRMLPAGTFQSKGAARSLCRQGAGAVRLPAYQAGRDSSRFCSATLNTTTIPSAGFQPCWCEVLAGANLKNRKFKALGTLERALRCRGYAYRRIP
jgi:hypothetical protein